MKARQAVRDLAMGVGFAFSGRVRAVLTAAGAGPGVALLLTATGTGVGWASSLPTTGIGAGVVLLVTLLSPPPPLRLMRPEGRRTE
ncbi:hypothetical protein [Streptomyces cinereospinus]|uniref:Holin n=1 Tax=Streptomyces cinereospinus TaxID=285561 RepID=A0ABV5N1S1_9ACTN